MSPTALMALSVLVHEFSEPDLGRLRFRLGFDVSLGQKMVNARALLCRRPGACLREFSGSHDFAHGSPAASLAG